MQVGLYASIMAMYRNPDTPPSYTKPEKTPQPEKNIIDGVRVQFLHLIIDSGIFDSDCEETYSDLEILNSDEEDNELPAENTTENEPPVGPNNQGVPSENAVTEVSKKQSTSSFVPDDRDSSKRKVVDYSSDSSTSSVKHDQKSKKHVAPSTETEKKNSEYLFGFYPCGVCNITLTNYQTFMTHMSGKKHQKAIKAKDATLAEIKPVDPTEVSSRYPAPPPGIVRRKIKEMSYIQEKVEATLRTPCPGLMHVIEIRGLKETSYYCSLCDSPCSVNCIISHLKGYKHTLQCLRLYNPDLFDKISEEPKYKVQREIFHVLGAVQRAEGMGYIVVEMDFLDENYSEMERDSGSVRSIEVRSLDTPSCSYQPPPPPPSQDPQFSDYYASTTVPDTSKSDFYCKICEAHMNSVEMWESHTRGKRHLTNIKKNPGARPSKMKLISAPHVHPYLLDKLRGIQVPIVGLSHIREVQNLETKNEMYNCFLCGGCLTSINIVEHILSMKHRQKYLEQLKHHKMEMLRNINVKENSLFHLIEDICYEVQAEYGTGLPEVFVSKGVDY